MKNPVPAILLVGGLLGAPMPATVLAQDSLGRYIDDATLSTRVKRALVDDPALGAARISVEAQQGIVLISGFANSEEEKTRAASVAGSVPEVREVQNNLIVRNPVEGIEDSERSASRAIDSSGGSAPGAPRDTARSGSTGVYRY